MAPADESDVEESGAKDSGAKDSGAKDSGAKEAAQVEERLAHEPEAAIAAAVLDPGHRPPVTYPDDDGLVHNLRVVDRAVGLGEQIALFGLLAVMVIVACVEAIAERMHSGFLWSFDVVRDATFAIAMLGAAFATYQQRNLSMDLVSRRLGHKARMFLRIFLALVTIFASSLFLYAGWLLRSKVVSEPNVGTLEKATVSMIPIGAALIIFHSLVQIVIEADYLARGKLSPERERTGH